MTKAAKETHRLPMAQLNVRAGLVRLAATCMADHDIRYYLNGVTVEPRKEGGAFIVASDGHRMMCIIDESATCSRATILSLSAREVMKFQHLTANEVGRKAEPSDQRLKLIDVEGDHCLALTQPKIKGLRDSAHTITSILAGHRVVDGKFTDWRRVLPDFAKLKPGLMAVVNTRYLVEPLTRGFKQNPKWSPGLTAWSTDENSIVAISFEQAPNVMMLVMPMRCSNHPSLAPVWEPIRNSRPYDPPEPAADAAADKPVAVPADGDQGAAGDQPAAAEAGSAAASPPAAT